MNTSATELSCLQEAACWHASSGRQRFNIASNDSLLRSPHIINAYDRSGSDLKAKPGDVAKLPFFV